MKSFFVALLLLLVVTLPAFSSVTIVPFSKSDKTVDDFPYVGEVVNINSGCSGSGTIIGNGRYVLTAKHVISHDTKETGMVLDAVNFNFILNGKTYKVSKVYGHPVDDLAILKLERKCRYNADIWDDRGVLGLTFYGVGYGRSISSPDTTNLVWDTPYGTKRVFKNRISSFSMRTNDTDDNYSWLLKFVLHGKNSDFAISGEGIHGPGDSGGGCFILELGKPKLMGVMLSLSVDAPYSGYLIRVKDYQSWIDSIIQPKKKSLAHPKIYKWQGEPFVQSNSKVDNSLVAMLASSVKKKRLRIVGSIICR